MGHVRVYFHIEAGLRILGCRVKYVFLGSDASVDVVVDTKYTPWRISCYNMLQHSKFEHNMMYYGA